MTANNPLSVCPRCAYDECLELKADAWSEWRGGFLAGFLTMAAFAVAILAALFGVGG